jgi:hypothetical protein
MKLSYVGQRWIILFLIFTCMVGIMVNVVLSKGEKSNSKEKGVVIDVDLTKQNAAGGKVTGGKWDNGWRVTGADNERIVFDAGYHISSGYLEVSFTANQNSWSGGARKINFIGLHEDPSLHQGQYSGDIFYIRTGSEKYKFSKVKAYGKKFDQTEWEQSVGETTDWITDDKTVHTVKLEWKDGIATFYDVKGNKHACPKEKCRADLPIDKLRYVFIGSDGFTGFTPKGVRFLKVKLVDYNKK